MKHLIIYSHLNPKSFTKAIVDKVAALVKAKGEELEIIDLISDKFNPLFEMHDVESMFMGKETPEDVKKYQEKIANADKLTIVYPLWWGQMPAQLKGFFDRVFANGFAFEYTKEGPKGLLKDKTAQIFVNTGTPNEVYESTGMFDAINRVNEGGLFAFCGMEAKTTFFGSVISCGDEIRTSYLESISELY